MTVPTQSEMEALEAKAASLRGLADDTSQHTRAAKAAEVLAHNAYIKASGELSQAKKLLQAESQRTHAERGEPHDFSDNLAYYAHDRKGGDVCKLCGIPRTASIEPYGWNICDDGRSHDRHRIIGQGGNYVTCDGLGHRPD